eukprot:m.82246 g.82246  ORF g.82246 m.82246 type:complete len:401 (+) comp11076_c0_seq1:160-1362(+)
MLATGLLLIGCSAAAGAECERVDVAQLLADPSRFEQLVASAKPVVLTNCASLENAWPPADAWRRWTDDEVLAKEFGNERVVASVVSTASESAVFESVVDTAAWPGAASFWRRWLKLDADADLPAEVWSLRDRSGLHQGVYEPCDPSMTPPDGQVCVRFSVGRIVTRPAKVGTRLGHVLSGQLASAFGSSKAQVYLQYQGLPDTMSAALGGDAMHLPRPPPFCHLTPEFVGLWVSGDDRETEAQLHYDPNENLSFQLAGDREWTLFPPSEGAQLKEGFMMEGDLIAERTSSEGASLRLHANETSGNLLDVSFSYFTSPLTHSEAASANLLDVDAKLVCKVKSGEALYLPAYWWHIVQATPKSRVSTTRPLGLAINFWFPALRPMPLGCTSCGPHKWTHEEL